MSESHFSPRADRSADCESDKGLWSFVSQSPVSLSLARGSTSTSPSTRRLVLESSTQCSCLDGLGLVCISLSPLSYATSACHVSSVKLSACPVGRMNNALQYLLNVWNGYSIEESHRLGLFRSGFNSSPFTTKLFHCLFGYRGR